VTPAGQPRFQPAGEPAVGSRGSRRVKRPERPGAHVEYRRCPAGQPVLVAGLKDDFQPDGLGALVDAGVDRNKKPAAGAVLGKLGLDAVAEEAKVFGLVRHDVVLRLRADPPRFDQGVGAVEVGKTRLESVGVRRAILWGAESSGFSGNLWKILPISRQEAPY